MGKVGVGRLERLLELADRSLDLETSDVTVNSLTSDTGVTATTGGLRATAGGLTVTAGPANISGSVYFAQCGDAGTSVGDTGTPSVIGVVQASSGRGIYTYQEEVSLGGQLIQQTTLLFVSFQKHYQLMQKFLMHRWLLQSDLI